MAKTDFFKGHLEYLVEKWYRSPSSAMQDLVWVWGSSRGYPIVQLMSRLGECTMARGNGKSAPKEVESKAGWTKFVTISLEGVTLEDVNQVYGDAGQLGDAVSRLLADGYRVGLSYDGERDCMIASLTCRQEGSVNNGCTFTSWAEEWPAALALMCYKHYEVCDGIWPSPTPRSTGAKFG